MKPRRIERVNSLLQEVISEVIHNEVKNPHLPDFISISHVEVSRDLQHAKVYVSVLGEKSKRNKAIEILTISAGFISTRASKKVTLRYFPQLFFILDDSVDKQLHIDSLLHEIEEKENGHLGNE